MTGNARTQKRVLGAEGGVAVLATFTLAPDSHQGVTTELNLLHLGAGHALLERIDITQYEDVSSRPFQFPPDDASKTFQFPVAVLLASGEETVVLSGTALVDLVAQAQETLADDHVLLTRGDRGFAFRVVTPVSRVRLEVRVQQVVSEEGPFATQWEVELAPMGLDVNATG